jgi:hypothetical protein
MTTEFTEYDIKFLNANRIAAERQGNAIVGVAYTLMCFGGFVLFVIGMRWLVVVL